MFNKMKMFISDLKDTATASYKDLSWPKRILKTILISSGLIIAILLIMSVGLFLAFLYIGLKVTSSFGPALENGMNEAMGRNRHRRF